MATNDVLSTDWFFRVLQRDMDRISGLSDELLVNILSFLPTKVAISTCKLSKRWECVWKFLPKLDFACDASRCESLMGFLNRNMPLHRAPVIESFCLDLSLPRPEPQHVKLWLVVAVSRSLRELDISYRAYRRNQDILPSSLYACKSLVVLKLRGDIFFDVPRRMVCLTSLKTLKLREVTGVDGESLERLLSVCPVLENLVVDFNIYDKYITNIGNVIVNVPSLQGLTLLIDYQCAIDRLEIYTPFLKYLKLEDLNEDNESCLIENMPELEEAYVDVRYADIKSLIGSITSVKYLTICSQAMYGDGLVFNQLEDLDLCHCTECSSTLLPRLLIDSPNLRALNIFQMRDHDESDMVLWNQPSHVPACFTSSLQTFSWSGYLGRQEEREVAVYVLKWASRLVTARISPDADIVPKLEMLKELSVSSRASTACQLFFD